LPQELLDHGADPNVGFLWEGLTSPFTALTGAFGGGEGAQPPHQYELELARLLLEHGADPNDSQTIYNRHWDPDNRWLELLLQFGLGTGSGGPWHERLGPTHPTPSQNLEDLLRWSVSHAMTDRVRILVETDVEVDGLGTQHPILGGRRAIEQAALDGSEDIVELLVAAGARRPDLSAVEAFLAACTGDDRAAVAGLLARQPGLAAEAAIHRPDQIRLAAELGRPEAVRRLVEQRFDVNARNRTTALHEAVWRNDLAMIRLLLELGADPTIADTEHNATPLGWAEHLGRHEIAELLRTRA
jgi:ankyrin repeat protein